MKEKYNIDVNVERSIYNFKFEYYIAEVTNVNDETGKFINVVKRKYYDENNELAGERLEDNYGEVYWEKALKKELSEQYKELFTFPDLEGIELDIAYQTIPMDKGVSTSKDENGVLIPLRPEDSVILDIDLQTRDFSDEFLNELLVVVKDLVKSEWKVDLFITGKSEERKDENNKRTTKVLNLPYEKFQEINTLEDLRNKIKLF